MWSDGSNGSKSSVSLDWLDRLDPTNRPYPSTCLGLKNAGKNTWFNKFEQDSKTVFERIGSKECHNRALERQERQDGMIRHHTEDLYAYLR